MPSLWISAASSSVRNSRLPYFAGRSMGVKLRRVQYPCRGGWPSGVRGKTQVFFSVDLAEAAFVSALAVTLVFVWARTNVGGNKTAAAIIKVFDETPKRLPIAPSSNLCGFYLPGFL